MPAFGYSILADKELIPVTVQKNIRRALLVDFWATWCTPCREATRRLSDLHAKLHDKGLHIVAMTTEQEPTVRAFLKNHPVPYHVALDNDSLASKAFGVRSLPFAVLVDNQSVVRWTGDPRILTEEAVQRFLDLGEAPASQPDSNAGATAAAGEPYLLIRISRSADQERNSIGISRGDTGTAISLKCKSKPIPQILRAAMNVSQPRLVVADNVSTDLYDIEFEQRMCGENHPAFDVLVNAILEQTRHSISYVSVEREVWIATCRNKVLDESKHDTPSIGFQKTDEYSAAGVEIPQLISAIEARYKLLIQDKTELPGRYDFSWKFDVPFDDLRRTLQAKYGIELRASQQMVTIPILKAK